MTTQTVHIMTYEYGASLTSATLRAIDTDALIATADTVNEVTADSGLYAAVFGEVAAIAAGTYRLRAVAGGQPISRYVTLAGVDAEVVQSRWDRFAELPPNGITAAVLATDAVAKIADGVWDEATAGHTTAGTYGGRVVRSANSNVEVQITGSRHIAADVHEFQTAVIVAGAFAANAITAAALAADAVTEIQSGLATAAAQAAAKAVLDKVDSGLIIDGAVYQFTANMLELGPSGGGGAGTVNVLPATGIVADRSAGTTLLPVVGETISQAITVYQSDGTTAVNLSGKTLAIIFETMSGTDVAVVANANITISGVGNNVVTFAYPSAVTASERVLRFAIRDAAAPLTMYLQGVCSVVAAPKVD